MFNNSILLAFIILFYSATLSPYGVWKYNLLSCLPTKCPQYWTFFMFTGQMTTLTH